jgi:hypothetical protein
MHQFTPRGGAALLAGALHLAALQAGNALAQDENPAAVLEAPTVEVAAHARPAYR